MQEQVLQQELGLEQVLGLEPELEPERKQGLEPC